MGEDGTAMDEKQWNSILHFASLPYEVDVQVAEAIHIDRSVKLGDFVQACLSLLPIKLGPGFSEPLQVSEGNTKIPLGSCQFIGKFGQRQLGPKAVDSLLWNRNRVWFWRHGHDCVSLQLKERNGRSK